jgi:dynein heavy chain
MIMQQERKQLTFFMKSIDSSGVASASELSMDDATSPVKDRTLILNYVINPKAIQMSQLYGEKDEASHDWIDGILSHRMRECAEARYDNLQWIIFDGPVDSVWVESLNTVLDDNRKLCLSSGEIIKLTSYISVLFEVEDLNEASPATVSRAGMIYMEDGCVQYESIIESWLSDLPTYYQYEKYKRCIRTMFDQLIPAVLSFIKENPTQFKMPVPSLPNSLVRSCARLLEVYLLKHYTRETMKIEAQEKMEVAEKAKREEEEKRR